MQENPVFEELKVMDDKYLQYSINDYLEDDHFVSDFFDGRLDINNWNAWFNSRGTSNKDFIDAIEVLKTMKFHPYELEESKINSLWENIDSESISKTTRERKIIIRRIAFSSIAAGIVILFGVLSLFIGQTKQVSTYAGEHIDFELPDKSEIRLNAVSYIRYNKKDFADSRKIDMSGEVLFDVRSGNPFLVETSLGSVNVLGTIFNVFSRDSVFHVECLEGSVEVISLDNDTVRLLQNESVRIDYKTGQFDKMETSDGNLAHWIQGQYRFTNASLSTVINELERQYNILIDIDEKIDPYSQLYTGVFTNDDLEKALQSVCWPLHCEYKIQGRQIHIFKE